MSKKSEEQVCLEVIVSSTISTCSKVPPFNSGNFGLSKKKKKLQQWSWLSSICICVCILLSWTVRNSWFWFAYETVVMAYVWCLYAFQELNKQTKPGHPDKKGLEKALAAVQVGVDVHQYFQNVRERWNICKFFDSSTFLKY